MFLDSDLILTEIVRRNSECSSGPREERSISTLDECAEAPSFLELFHGACDSSETASASTDATGSSHSRARVPCGAIARTDDSEVASRIKAWLLRKYRPSTSWALSSASEARKSSYESFSASCFSAESAGGVSELECNKMRAEHHVSQLFRGNLAEKLRGVGQRSPSQAGNPIHAVGSHPIDIIVCAAE